MKHWQGHGQRHKHKPRHKHRRGHGQDMNTDFDSDTGHMDILRPKIKSVKTENLHLCLRRVLRCRTNIAYLRVYFGKIKIVFSLWTSNQIHIAFICTTDSENWFLNAALLIPYLHIKISIHQLIWDLKMKKKYLNF